MNEYIISTIIGSGQSRVEIEGENGKLKTMSIDEFEEFKRMILIKALDKLFGK